MAPVIHGPRCNRRVTTDTSLSNARSESSIAVNPLDPLNLVGSSKRFTNPATYTFSLAAYTSFDGGLSWIDSGPLPLLPGWQGASDPYVAWDSTGGAYIAALPLPPGTSPVPPFGIAIYRSPDGGRTWPPPTLIHPSTCDDKQTAAGDNTPTSPHYGNVYVAWDDGSALRFARTIDQGKHWVGTGTNPAGTQLSSSSLAPAIAIAPDGTLYIAWAVGIDVSFVKSTDGGNSFSVPKVAVSNIKSLDSAGLILPGESFPKLPGGKFRVETILTACSGSNGQVVLAWADYRDNSSRIYYCSSADGGATWAGAPSGKPLLTGHLQPFPAQHDFQPQLASTPAGEIGCAYYEFGPRGPIEFPSLLIDAFLAVSTDGGQSFPNLAVITERPWDPRVDAPLSNGHQDTTFIGDYFGLAASILGFFPFFLSTITGIQEMYVARLCVNPADLYIRDSFADIGDVPSPGFIWYSPDLIVRRQPDGDVHFVHQEPLRNLSDHYVYGRVTNRGPNEGRNVRLAVVVGNHPSQLSLPGTQFRYPQDWYQNDWATAAVKNRHLFLGESNPVAVPNGATKIVGPIVFPGNQISQITNWDACLLGEVRADNDDSAGGMFGCDIPANPNSATFGGYFWGNNNACQRNITITPVGAKSAHQISFSFLVGHPLSIARFLEVILEKPIELATTVMTLENVPIPSPPPGQGHPCQPSEIIFEGKCSVIVRHGDCDIGKIETEPGTIWRPTCPSEKEECYGGHKTHQGWDIVEGRGSVGFPVTPGEQRRFNLTFTTPTTLDPGTSPIVSLFERVDNQTITGGVFLELMVT